jgi:hypothetical protein
MSTGARVRTGLALLCVALPAFALQPPDPKGTAEQTGEAAQAQLPERPSAPEPKPQPAATPSPDTVTPTERIEADSAVSFPVDI